MKYCTRCKIEKPLTEFNKQAGLKDGLTYKCKPCASACAKEWANKNREYVREYCRKKYAMNPQPKKDSAKRYREANLDKAREANKKWRMKNKEKARDKFLFVRYGLSTEKYESMFKSQNGGCRSCGKQSLDGKRLFVDHDHNTGTVRGLLCHHCNAGIGHFFDDPFLLQCAIKYLTESNKETV